MNGGDQNEPGAGANDSTQQSPGLGHDSQFGRFQEPSTDLDFSPPLDTDAQLAEGSIVGGRFRIMQMLGKGGMGIVYLAYDELLNEERALKVMLPKLVTTPEAQNRFYREIKALRSLSHPGVIRTFDCGRDEEHGCAYFTMEYIEGEPLSARLERCRDSKNGPFDVDLAIRYMRELLNALTHAHEHVIHRDLKPHNVMVRRDGSLVILDFGLAKILSDEQFTKSATALGTPMYMSPEQWRRGDTVGIRSDIYSAGVILYELVTLEIPSGRFAAPSMNNPKIPRALDRVILKCLESNPKDRYPDAPSLLADLDRAIRKPTIALRWIVAAVLVAALVAGSFFAMDNMIPGPNAPVSERTYVVETEKQSPTIVSDTAEVDDEALREARNADEAARNRLESAEKTMHAQIEEDLTPHVLSVPRQGSEVTFLGMEFVWIPAGEFMMGSPLSASEVQSKYGDAKMTEEWWWQDENPRHHVSISQGFWLGKYEVTVADFQRFVDTTGYKTDAEKGGDSYSYTEEGIGLKVDDVNWSNPGWKMPRDDQQPVVHVSWNDAIAFCNWLGSEYRLPTEAEWEYACRAGTTTVFIWGNDPADGDRWLNGADETQLPSGRNWDMKFDFNDGFWSTAPVGSFRANRWGLHDMVGNVWEWCADLYGSNYYAQSPSEDPIGPSSGLYRVFRGGSWFIFPANCRTADRHYQTPDYRTCYTGFRVVRTP